VYDARTIPMNFLIFLRKTYINDLILKTFLPIIESSPESILAFLFAKRWKNA